jgi:hypothetical protein
MLYRLNERILKIYVKLFLPVRSAIHGFHLNQTMILHIEVLYKFKVTADTSLVMGKIFPHKYGANAVYEAVDLHNISRINKMGIILVSIENKDERGLLDHENGYLSFFL